MISTLSALLELIKSGPAILSAFIELKKMWDQYLEVEKRREVIQQFGDAINVARTKRDTTQLTDLVNNIITGNPVK